MINKKKRAGRTAAVAAVAAVGISLTALAGSASAAPAPMAPKLPPIIIMQTVPVDSAITSFPGMPTGAAVAAAAINGAGGINGRPLQLVYCDDKGNAQLAIQCTQQGISAGAVARVSSLVIAPAQANPLLMAASVASFGGQPVAGSDFTDPNQFPLSTGSYMYTGFAPLMKKKYPAAKTAVIMNIDVAGRQVRVEQITQGAAKVGITILKDFAVPPAIADMSSIAGQIAALKPDVILAGITSAQMVKWFSASQSLGLQIPILEAASQMTPDVIAQAGSAASYTSAIDYYPDYTGSTPGAATFRAQMAKYATGQPVNRNAWVGWVGVTAFANIIKSMKNPITPAKVWGTISNVKCFNTLYFTCLNFTKPGPIPGSPAIRVTNLFLLDIKNGALASTPYTYAIS